MTSFQARAATKPKPEVVRVSIWLMMTKGMSLGCLGGLIFLLIVNSIKFFLQKLQELIR